MFVACASRRRRSSKVSLEGLMSIACRVNLFAFLSGDEKVKETDEDKLGFCLDALDMPDPFVKNVPLDTDIEDALQWMAKVCA